MRLGRNYVSTGAFLGFLTCFLLWKSNRYHWPATKRDVLLDYAASCFDTLASNLATLSPTPRSTPITVIIAAVSGDSSANLERESGLHAGDAQVIYFADRPSPQDGAASVPQNKGNEAMVYLTYLIDNYENLPDVMVFMHGHRTAWHNNALIRRSSSLTVNKLRPEAVLQRGFVNLACDNALRRAIEPIPGAAGPSVLALTREDWEAGDEDSGLRSQSPERLYARYTDLWHGLFPLHTHDAPPSRWGYLAGGQFALSRQVAESIPKDRLVFLRNWIVQTSLPSKSAGAVFETLWEAVFSDSRLGNTTTFATTVECYCELYGLCQKDERLPAERVEVLVEAAALMIGHLLDNDTD